MFRLLKAAAAITIGMTAIVTAQAAPLSTWYGEFGYEHALGRIGEAPGERGVAIFVNYTLRLGPGYGATGCRIDAQGYQTYQRIKCTATPQGESVIVKFYRFNPDNIGGHFYMGQPLVTLSRTERGIVTQWQGLPPPEGAPRRGVAFHRIGRAG